MEQHYNYEPVPGFDLDGINLNLDFNHIDLWDPVNDPLGTTLPPYTEPEPITAPLTTEFDYQYLLTMSSHDSTSPEYLDHNGHLHDSSLYKPYPQEAYYNYPPVGVGLTYDYTQPSLQTPYSTADASHCYPETTTAGPYEGYLTESPINNTYGFDPNTTPSPSMSYTTPTTPIFAHPQSLVCPHPGCPRGATPFSRQCDLNKHMKTHEKNQLCTLPLATTGAPCGQRFATMKDLRRHQGAATHGVEASHVCPYCGSAKSRPDNLRDHIRRKHNLDG